MAGEAQRRFTALRVSLCLSTQAHVASGAPLAVRRQDGYQPVIALDLIAHQQRVAPRNGQDLEDEFVVIAVVGDGEQRQERSLRVARR